MSTRRQRTFSFWDHHNAMDVYTLYAKISLIRWTLSDLFKCVSLGPKRLRHRYALCTQRHMWTAHVGSFFGSVPCIFLLLPRSLGNVKNLVDRQYSNWKPPLFRSCKKLYPWKYCWSHNQSDSCLVNIASRFSDLVSNLAIQDCFWWDPGALRGGVGGLGRLPGNFFYRICCRQFWGFAFTSVTAVDFTFTNLKPPPRTGTMGLTDFRSTKDWSFAFSCFVNKSHP